MGGAKEAELAARSSSASREAGNRGVSSAWLIFCYISFLNNKTLILAY
jgi:hypothetical protein